MIPGGQDNDPQTDIIGITAEEAVTTDADNILDSPDLFDLAGYSFHHPAGSSQGGSFGKLHVQKEISLVFLGQKTGGSGRKEIPGAAENGDEK